MKRPSLNHVYRLVWNDVLGVFVAVAEGTRGKGKSGGRLLASVILGSVVASAGAAPNGGVVTSGSASISQSGLVTNIDQSTQKASINWQGFSIGRNETVNFNQPNSSALTLNRVIGNEKSIIEGALNANGKVFLINSNGMLFTKGSSVNTGGFVGSTLNLTDEDFNAGNYVFKSNGGAGSIINLGTITAKDGGYVALLGNNVSNQGVIVATKGTVALSAGDKITLNFNGDSLLSVSIDEGTLNALVENKQAIYADGGTVYLTARAADALLGAQVNNSGIVQARTIDDLKGKIELYAHGGTAHVDGTLDASASTGGDGGFIETSGDKVSIADSAVVTTKAAIGKSGTWLIDPTNFTIALGNGGQTTSSIGASTLASLLANGNISIATSSAGSEAGDININAALTWSAANTLTLAAAGDINANAAVTWSSGGLTLSAGKNINVNSTLTASGTGNFAANWGNGSNSDGTPYALYALQSAGFTGKINFSGSGTVSLNGSNYTVLSSNVDLAKINADPTGRYVLGADLTTAGLTAALGLNTPFTGVLEGFGHTVNLSYTASTGKGFAGSGLFNMIGVGGLIRNLGVTGSMKDSGSHVVATTNIGALANINQGTILNAYSSASIAKTLQIANLGGLVGLNEGTISLSSFAGNVYAYGVAGGLVGTNAASGVISLSDARNYPIFGVSGATGISYVGGLVGVNYGSIDRSWASQAIQLTDSNSIAGGLVGLNAGSIDQSYAARSLTNYSTGPHLAGFVGINTGSITNSYSTMLYDDPYYVATTSSGVTVGSWIAGFAYKNSGSIATSYATTYAYDSAAHAGFVYDNTGGTTTKDYWYAGLASGATAYTDNSTAKQLTEAQAAKFSSYSGFSSSAWSTSASGYPILGNLPVYVSATGTYGESPVYAVFGLQGGGGAFLLRDNPNDSDLDPFHVLDSSGYIDAGGNSASSVIASSAYSCVRGIITITPKALTFADGTIADKTYDGITGATAGTVALLGLVGKQTLNISGLSGTFSDANAGEDKTVTLTYSAANGSNGGKASNYTIATTTTATIDPKALTVTADVADKTYDGTTSATVYGGSLSGILAGDTVVLDSLSGAFTDKNAGANKSIVISDAVLSGSSAGNYTISEGSIATTTADITPRVIELYGTKGVNSSTTVSASQLAVVNAVEGDTVNLSGSVTIANSSAGVQSITNTSKLSTSNSNYTVLGSVGSVVVGNASLVLDKVASGSATVSSSGKTTTVSQTTDKAVIDWYRFSVASGETLTFVQPSTSSIVLNRVVGSEKSIIAGALNANGKVFVINSNGVLFKAGSSVNVGALLASTLDISDSDFMNGNYVFTSKGGKGSVVEEGAIVIVEGGFLALVSQNGVTANGSIVAPGSTAVLASARELTLNLDSLGNKLDSYEVVNLAGTTTVGGSIDLRSGMGEAATLETAGEALKIKDSLVLKANAGDTWSLSLPSITIDSGGSFTGSWVSSRLAGINVALNALRGDLTLNNAIAWNSDSLLTLNAANDININKSITASGANAGLAMNYGGDYKLLTKASYSGAVLDAKGNPVADSAPAATEYASITLSGANARLKINGNTYKLIHGVNELDALDKCINGLCYNPTTGAYDQSVTSVMGYKSIYVYYLSGGNYYNPTTQAYDIPQTTVVNGTTYYYNVDTRAYDLTAAYAGKNLYFYLDSATSLYTIQAYDTAASKYWNPSTGQYDLSARYTGYNAYYDVATGLYDKPAYDTSTGKYYSQTTGLYDSMSGVTTVNTYYYNPDSGVYDLTAPVSVSGYYALASDLDAAGTTYGGSLLFSLNGTLAGLGHSISNLTIDSNRSWTTTAVYEGMISQTERGSVIRDIGLVNPVESFTNGLYATTTAGPLVGMLNGSLSQAYVEGGTLTIRNGTIVTVGNSGGLVGLANYAAITDSYSTMSGVYGGLAYRTQGGSVVRSHATGKTSAGGLIGGVYDGTLIDYDYATGDTGKGGLIGSYDTAVGYGNSVTNSFATGDVTGTASIGGLIGSVAVYDSKAPLTIANTYASGNVYGDYDYQIQTYFGLGGLVGYVYGSVNISDSHATGNVTAGTNVSTAGGLVGQIESYSSSLKSSITNSYATGDVTSAGTTGYTGGLVGNMSYTTVTDSYATGDVNGYNSVGGVAEVANNSTISNSYSEGLITARRGFGLNTVVGGIVGTGYGTNIYNSYYNAELNAGHVVGGYGNPMLGSSFRDLSTGLTTVQMADAKAYANGAIAQVLTDRASEAARQQTFRDAGTQVATNEVAQALKPSLPAPEQIRPDAFRSPAGSLDQNIVFADARSFSTDIRRIEVDGKTFILDEEVDGKGKSPAVPVR